MNPLLEKPETLPYWRVVGTLVQVSVGAAFGMVVGQAIEVARGGRPSPPGVFAWSGAALGALIGGASHHIVSQAKTVYA